jgi:signal transduction histidine kinase/ActR/RegA family two-component response regulator
MVPLELINIFTQLHCPGDRQSGLRALAVYTNAADVFLFGKDQEIGVFLPAQGLPQTIRHGIKWQAFIKECAKNTFMTGVLPTPDDGIEVRAFGIADKSGSALLIFLGNEPAEEKREHIAALLPMTGAKLVVERTALSTAGHAAAARDANQHARSLNTALDVNRRELQKAFERAEKELAHRREAEKKLRDTDRRKDEFLAMLAHELRNPLAPISMAAQIIKLPLATGKDRIDQASRIIDRQVKHMTSLLDDLLDVSRVTRGQITLNKEPIEIKDIVAEAIEQTRPFIEAREHRLTVQLAHEPARVQGDRTRLVQIITNLLNNAAKYMPKGGEVSLQLEIREGDIHLTVQDKGIGIDEALLPQIFELFTQAERSSDRSQGGLGLGLALVKNLVELHGGSVSAHSEGAGMGSEFVVRLPRFLETLQQLRIPKERSAHLVPQKALHVMVVDDNADAADMLAAFLEASGHKVLVAYLAQEAIRLVRIEAPDVLLLDIGLTDMDGHELARKLKAMPQTANATLIALTGYGQPHDQERAMAAGFHYHLTKPADPLKMIELLAEISRRVILPSQSAI